MKRESFKQLNDVYEIFSKIYPNVSFNQFVLIIYVQFNKLFSSLGVHEYNFMLYFTFDGFFEINEMFITANPDNKFELIKAFVIKEKDYSIYVKNMVTYLINIKYFNSVDHFSEICLTIMHDTYKEEELKTFLRQMYDL